MFGGFLYTIMQYFNSKKTRVAWIDWMKTIGIYFIVLGHFFSIGHKFIYVFNVPLFFLISGFLCKKEKDNRLFLNKLLYNLIIPMVIISTIVFLYLSIRHETIEIINIVRFLEYGLLGYHYGIHECWFVYTLCLLKIIYQYCPRSPIFYTIGFFSLFGAYVFNHIDLSHYNSLFKASNSLVNVFTAFPFYAAGVFLRDFKEQLDKMRNYIMLGFTFVCGMVLVYLSAYNNGYVWMYICSYGGNMLWFLLGGIAGAASIFAISKMLGRAPMFVEKISNGTILILGFHIYIIPLFSRFYHNSYYDFISAFVIVLLFIPIIILAEKHFPLLLGKYRLNKIREL